MKRLTSTDNLLIATLWQRVLESAGIRCEIRNRYIGGAIGELPADQVAPQIWIADDHDAERAAALIADLRNPQPSPSWRCVGCGELVEGQFFQCWNCETARGA